MFHDLRLLLDLSDRLPYVAQIAPELGAPAGGGIAVFSGPQFLVALISGLMMTFGFQLLLTNLSIAFITFPRGSSSSDKDDDSESFGSTVRSIETKVGLWMLVTITIALSIACFLAVKLSLVTSTLLGAIIGIVIWSTYFSLLVWLGSSAVGSLIGSVINAATSGFQSLIGTTTAALGANIAKNQAVSTAEDIAAAVRRELTSGLDPTTIRRTLQNSLSNLSVPNLDLDKIGRQFERLIDESELRNVSDSSLLQSIDRQSFVDLLKDRTDLSKKEINQIADKLDATWKQTAGKGGKKDFRSQLTGLLKSVTSEDLKSDDLVSRLRQLVRQGSQEDPSLTSQAFQFGLSAVLGQVLGNANLSDLDVEKVSGQLQKIKGAVLGGERPAGKQTLDVSSKPFSVIQTDLEHYLLFTPAWELNQEAVKQHFKEVIYDPQADPGAIRQELESVSRNYFVDTLSLRNDLNPERIQALADRLEEARKEIFNVAQMSEAAGRSQDLRRRVENYLRSTRKEEFNPESIEREFGMLLSDSEESSDVLRDRLNQFDRVTLEQILQQRQDMTPEETNQIVGQLETTRDRVLLEAGNLQERAKASALELRGKVENYLRNTHKDELNPEGIRRDLHILLNDPQGGLSALRFRLSQFDRDTLVQLLSQREDLSEEQVNQVLDQVEAVRDSILHAPRKAADKAKEQYVQTTTAIANYLRDTNLEELDPEGIKRDLTTLLDDPKAGAFALRDRLSQVDRETLVKLLSQRGDLTEEQVNQTIDRLQSAIRDIIKAPRRLARRAQARAITFEENLESYLRNTDKEELNPEGIKRDLQLLLQHPRAGLSSLGDRVSHFDRATFVALLSQRQDITEEEANRIADQIESTYRSLVEQVQNIQRTIQSAIDSVLAKIRDYLNSLERPELNYDSIQEDFRTLFDDPQAGFEALRNRLGQFDRGTLVAVLSSREDISEADANRILDKIEETRNNVLRQGEQIQQEVQRRFRKAKEQAQRQAQETQKAAATAAWWLFGTALTSLIASALAGTLGVSGARVLSSFIG
ncbi:MFS transporter [Altericista sp. CCNU0014]|uniref:MFS transporter n=1 Tax=Altericista sp. CCNU0014 TaxID=3082949 RepID=UPI003850E4A7